MVKRGVGMFVAPGARARLRNSRARQLHHAANGRLIRDRMARLGIDPANLLSARTRLGQRLRRHRVQHRRAGLRRRRQPERLGHHRAEEIVAAARSRRAIVAVRATRASRSTSQPATSTEHIVRNG